VEEEGEKWKSGNLFTREEDGKKNFYAISLWRMCKEERRRVYRQLGSALLCSALREMMAGSGRFCLRRFSCM
jgi:hypothetical protein